MWDLGTSGPKRFKTLQVIIRTTRSKAHPLFVTWVSPLRTGCRCTTTAALPLVVRLVDPGCSPVKDNEEAYVQDLTL